MSANFCQLRSRKKVKFLSSILKAFSNGAGNFVSGIFVLFSSFFFKKFDNFFSVFLFVF